MRSLVLLSTVLVLSPGCAGRPGASGPASPPAAPSPGLASWLASYDSTYQRLYYEAQKAEWESNTRIVEGDTATPNRTKRAKEALAAFVGSSENIRRIQSTLARRNELTPLQVRRLEAMLFLAAGSPETVQEVVRRRISVETEQVERLFGFTFMLQGRPVTPNQIDEILRQSDAPEERRAAWEASKEVGKVLRPGMLELRDLRNRTVQGLGYSDYFTYKVSEYEMSASEMLALTDRLLEQLWPLYRELHTWVRYELARRYRTPVPDLIPAHWLPNRWGQQWDALVEVAGLPVDSALADKTPTRIVQAGEEFWRSLGLGPLPPSFWELSSLYELPPDATYKKNTHASAWHMDLDRDVRSLMSVRPDAYWYETAIHELGHIYYYLSYSRPEVPFVLRSGANRAYHEGIGTMMGLAASQRRFLVRRGLVPAAARVDPLQKLLREAFSYVVFIPWSAGVMTRFEHALYAGSLPADRLNAAWWELKREYQGIVPPAPRGEEYTDAASKTHITDDPGEYYDYALSFALLFQLHDHIARRILQHDPHDTDYFGNPEVGRFLRDLMAPGASRSWRDVLRETTGRELDARAMVEYFQPLYDWLREQNRGRAHTLPERAPGSSSSE